MLTHAQIVQTDVHYEGATHLSENTAAAFDRTAINDPDFATSELLQKMRLGRANSSEARHFGQTATV